MNTPVWFMDVDGVLNDWRILPQEGWERFESELGYEITFDPTLLKRIVDLHVNGDVKVVWLTTWCENANTNLRERFGFPEDLEVIGSHLYNPNLYENAYTWWKASALEEFMDAHPNTKIIWTDDEIAKRYRGFNLVSDHGERLFYVSPAHHLTHDHITMIEDWIKK